MPKKIDMGGFRFAPYSVQMQVWQGVKLLHDTGKEATIAATWIGTTWVACDVEGNTQSRETFRSRLQSIAEEFAADFLENNPPQN